MKPNGNRELRLQCRGPAAGADRARRAHLANMRQELLAPVTAPGRLRRDADREGRGLALEDLGADLQRILISAQELLELVDRLLDVDGVDGHRSGADLDQLQAKVRHDLRNPLNAIKGYAELLLEEIDELGADPSVRPGSASLRSRWSAVTDRCDRRFSSSNVDAALGDQERGAPA